MSFIQMRKLTDTQFVMVYIYTLVTNGLPSSCLYKDDWVIHLNGCYPVTIARRCCPANGVPFAIRQSYHRWLLSLGPNGSGRASTEGKSICGR